MSIVKFSPIAPNFGYDFVLLVNFLGHPENDAYTSHLFQGNLQFYIIFLLFGLLVKGKEIELNVIIYLPRAVFSLGIFYEVYEPTYVCVLTKKTF